MNKRYITPRMTVRFITQQQLIAFSGGSQTDGIGISQDPDIDDDDDNRVKSMRYNVWDDDWSN